MSEERERILTLLEQGKINADQAARLIQALGQTARPEPPEPPSWPRRPRRVLAGELDRIPDIVAEAVSSAVRSGFAHAGEMRTSFAGKKHLFLKSVSGNVELTGSEEDRVVLEGGGTLLRARERGDQLMVRSISGDVGGQVPREIRLEIVSVSGDVKVSGIDGSLKLKSVSGDVDLSDVKGEVGLSVVSGDLKLLSVAGTLEVESKSGDIELCPSGPIAGSVESKSGDIVLRLRQDADVVLEMECEEDGDISVEDKLEYEVLSEGERTLSMKLGQGSRVLRLRTRRADIRVKRAKEE